MVRRREKTGHPGDPYQAWVPLGDAIYSFEHLKTQLIHPNVAADFIRNGDAVTTEFAESVERFLDVLVRDEQKHVAEMLRRVAPILADWDRREAPLPHPVVGEDDHLIPPEPPLRAAWLEAENWFEGICVYGWVDDPRNRPTNTEKGYPRWLFWACIELALEFLKSEPDSPSDHLLALFFLQENGWQGWERVIPRVPQEVVKIDFPGFEFIRKPDEPRSLFAQRVLGWMANEVLEQINSEARSAEWLAAYGCVPRPQKPEVARGRKASKNAEKYLVKRMLGRAGTRSMKKGKNRSPDPDASVGRQTRRLLILLGFVADKTASTKLLEAWHSSGQKGSSSPDSGATSA
jgi:hypothetical protein